MNLRSGRLKGQMKGEVADFTSSLEFDRRIFQADVRCNQAHTTMLIEQGIIPSDIGKKILKALDELEKEGITALKLDSAVEDIHMAVENYVTSKIGPEAGFMHTAKSRNDQVATDLRIALKEEIEEIEKELLLFIKITIQMAQNHLDSIMVGYTHLQHAQPTTFAHHLISYAQALKRDYGRLYDAYHRMNLCPLGSAALTTTSFPINREQTAKLLGFSGPMENSIDGVSSRDFIAETVFALTLLGTTLSKISEELIIWSTYEFRMVELADEFSSTSSIMPQKKNPDVAEIVRGKTAVLNGELVTILTIIKSLPQSYNRDLQEVTPHLWKATDTLHSALRITREMLASAEFKDERGEELARANFSAATELADLMVKEGGLPFRTAHQIVGRTVSTALDKGMKAEDVDAQFLDDISQELTGKTLGIDESIVKKALDPQEIIGSRKVIGGPAPSMVQEVIDNLREFVDNPS
ncbi:argininosuccinate lyase [Methanobacterium petrolearium]|uniref:argininosuccinate lyase n=1 Tax=Methanobacterium petrolearium TaxID=710190 RepID=UPI001AEA6E80|nr:argininosuccinate lyase [Methanobacterium petrolearium]MBP1945767.1 argininosuccinate lyase [Methanobacterium petrolearium]BDZ72015.1 argininosuccinate lyase [Methanobacterium petrolearium]